MISQRQNKINKTKIKRIHSELIGLSDGPAGSIASHLISVINHEFVEFIDDNNLKKLILKIEELLNFFPKMDSARFMFDANLLLSIIASCNSNGPLLTQTTIPAYGKEWSHTTIPLPSFDPNKIPFIYFICFKGDNEHEEISLLDYPWLFHEIGHNITKTQKLIHKDVSAPFEEKFESKIKQYKLRCIADSEAYRQRSLELISRIEDYWSFNEANLWIQEIVADTIALWLSGPSFIHTYLRSINEISYNPYEVSKEHPPLELRSKALLVTSEKLSWDSYNDLLRQKIHSWETQHKEEIVNEYIALADDEIVENVINFSIALCNKFSLPLCENQHIEDISNTDVNGLDLNLNLIITAWKIHHVHGEEYYNQWEENLIKKWNKAML